MTASSRTDVTMETTANMAPRVNHAKVSLELKRPILLNSLLKMDVCQRI